jgi:hypothetical protein
MAALHDMQCTGCDKVFRDMPIEAEHGPHICGKGFLEILWVTSRARDAAVHTSERAVVWRDPKTGTVAYPPTNSAIMPERYQKRGYEYYELPSLNALQKFERDANVRSERAWFDKGSGRGFEDA